MDTHNKNITCVLALLGTLSLTAVNAASTNADKWLNRAEAATAGAKGLTSMMHTYVSHDDKSEKCCLATSTANDSMHLANTILAIAGERENIKGCWRKILGSLYDAYSLSNNLMRLVEIYGNEEELSDEQEQEATSPGIEPNPSPAPEGASPTDTTTTTEAVEQPSAQPEANTTPDQAQPTQEDIQKIVKMLDLSEFPDLSKVTYDDLVGYLERNDQEKQHKYVYAAFEAAAAVIASQAHGDINAHVRNLANDFENLARLRSNKIRFLDKPNARQTINMLTLANGLLILYDLQQALK
ncbi:MAG: hypothetical protein H6679_04965 [Epsilonproteobacteria bacterium]|nr:hypothetical protein [Campylobacterota bacterium]